jgi:4'-phosphopantetheinyl transferase
MAAAEIHFGSLDVAAGEVERLTLLLSADERARAARFAFARDRRRFVVRRARLREILAAATGMRAERLVYTANSYGKPSMASDGLRFSTSHSHETWAVALSDREIGVDVEHHQADLDWRDLADSLFGPAERAALRALPPEDAIRGFFDCWARKEAFVKAIGMGLSYPLDAFSVSVTPEAHLLSGADGWSIAGLSIAAQHAAAVVVADDGLQPDLRIIPSD